MVGISVWADYNVFHGLGVEAEGTTIFGNKPTPYSPIPHTFYGSLKEGTIQAGVIYKFRPLYGVRPFVKALGGIGEIDFPHINPLYTSENSGVYTLGGGVEYKVWRAVFVRGQYEYQSWPGFRSGSQSLNPDGFSIGATYYLGGVRTHD